MQKSSGASSQALEESRRFKLELDSVGGKISSLEASNAAHMVSFNFVLKCGFYLLILCAATAKFLLNWSGFKTNICMLLHSRLASLSLNIC